MTTSADGRGDAAPPDGAPASGEGRDIGSLVADGALWGELLGAIAARIKQPHLFERMAQKDLYVTEAIRYAVVPSEIYPDARVVFKGGTSLAKAYSMGLIYRACAEMWGGGWLRVPEQGSGPCWNR